MLCAVNLGEQVALPARLQNRAATFTAHGSAVVRSRASSRLTTAVEVSTQRTMRRVGSGDDIEGNRLERTTSILTTTGLLMEVIVHRHSDDRSSLQPRGGAIPSGQRKSPATAMIPGWGSCVSSVVGQDTARTIPLRPRTAVATCGGLDT
jgi:hypothetical protein